MAVFLYSLCLLSAFGGRAGFVVNRSQHLSVGCAVTLVGGRAEMEGLGGASCKAGLSLCSVTITSLLGWISS